MNDKRFNLLFSFPRFVLVPSKKFNCSGAKVKNGSEKISSKNFIVWQIIRLSSLVIETLFKTNFSGLCQESLISTSSFYLSFSIQLNSNRSIIVGSGVGKRKSRIIQINFSEHKADFFKWGSLISKLDGEIIMDLNWNTKFLNVNSQSKRESERGREILAQFLIFCKRDEWMKEYFLKFLNTIYP